MSDFGKKLESTFRPHRGKEATIQKTQKEPGYMFYATDTHRMFFDLDHATRQGVRSEGVIFVYGEAYTEDAKPPKCEDLYFIHEINEQPGTYRYPRDKIIGHYNTDDIIINTSDGSFYKILNTVIDPIYVHCALLMVAGTGGSKNGVQLRENTLFPDRIAYGQSATASFIPVSYEGHTSGKIYLYIYGDENASQYTYTDSYQARVNEVTEITIDPEHLAPGDKNFIKVIFRTSDGMESVPLTYQIICVDLTFELDTNAWNYTKVFSETNPVEVPWRAYTDKSSVPAGLKINVDWTFADTHYPTESTEFKQNQQQIRSFADATKDLPQGTYRIQAHAHVILNNTRVDIGSIDVEIPWAVEGSEDPVIWSKFPSTSTIPKFTLISIEYMIYDPLAIKTNKTTVTTYLSANNEVVEEEGRAITIINGIATDIWDVAEYNEGENVFAITCRTTTKTFYVNIVPNENMQLDPIAAGCIMWFNAKGRANSESPMRRASWPNKIALSENHFAAKAIPVLSNFNWYNNGWQKDADGNNVLRLSNGAKVEIPLNDLLSYQNRTYEFDFKVHNAINYSKLINITTIYKKDSEGNLILDDYGRPIPETEKDDAGNEHEKIQKTVSSGEGAFLKFYDVSSKQGYMLGTQEAFFACSQTDIANVRYADDTRVKISFVVRYSEKITETDPTGKEVVVNPTEKYIYIYVDGVLSAAYPINFEKEQMNCRAPAIEINSEYCDVDLYNIRVYETALDYNGIITNWIGDSSTLQVMTEKYLRNNLTTGSGIHTTLDYEKVKNSGLIPVMVLTTYGDGLGDVDDLLPYKKGDKRMCGVRYYDPTDLNKNFHAYNCEIDVQGTSSQGYPRRNYKLKTKKFDDKLPFYFEVWDGVEENKDFWVSYAEGASEEDKRKQLEKWDLGHGIKETTFCLKADYMESSSSHNTGLANLVANIQGRYDNKEAYDFRHPLDRLHGEKSRTTIYGYPILVFHEQKVVKDGVTTTPIQFIGKYNFNIDKGATDSFGFTNKTINPASQEIYPEYIECVVAGKKKMYPVELVYNEDGTLKVDESTGGLYYYHPAERQETLLMDKENVITSIGKGTYKQVAECWEFTQNQPGPGKFQEQIGGFYATDTNTGKIIAADHFEMRYHYADFDDPYKSNDVVTANGLFMQYTKNLAKMVDWVASTDVSVNAEQIGNLDKKLPENKRYVTRDTQYVDGHVYYESLTATEPYDVKKADSVAFVDTSIKVDTATFLAQLKTVSGASLGDYTISCEFEEEKEEIVDTETGEVVEKVTINILAWHLEYLKAVGDQFEVVRLAQINDLKAWGITLPADWGTSTILFTYAHLPTRWKSGLYQEYTHDTKEYRLAKFKNEFNKHFNLAHTLFYYVMTELLLLYDSRQKNMMMASWGPEQNGGDYIWYPIFYDMDTQLGVNNSGQVYWDYDTEATPKDNPDASIFSGTGSVFWANVSTCFEEEIKFAYRQLRSSSLVLSESTLQKAYNTNQSDRWSEQMKNLDAFFKYIAPTDENYGGFIATDGKPSVSGTYLYCLQGDRKLNRNAFFRNRLNYIDSQWLGGNYDPTYMSNAITMRYNLNDAAKTSDGKQSEVDGAVFNGDPNYKITPFLTQYVSVAYDKIPATPVRFDIADKTITYADVQAPETIRNRADAGVMLTQQLAYVYGPQFISDLGDLSDKYLNVFQSESAIRLRNLQIGNDKPGYKNIRFSDLDRKENGKNSAVAKTLLRTIDFSNLNELAGSYDVSGCLKLQSFKALGTKLTSIPFPQGSLLEKVYFPETIERIAFEAPLSLANIITDPVRTSWVENEGTWIHNNDNGLYIENLTNKLDTIPSQENNSYTSIKYYQMDNTQMGYDTYRMLEYLYNLKQKVRDAQVQIYKAEQAGALTTEQQATKLWAQKSPAELRIQVLNAEWTPYKKVELDSMYNSLVTYYKLNDNLTYSVFNTTESTWEQDLKDYEIFEKVRGESPAKNLNMFDTFIKDFTSQDCSVTSQTYPYIYRGISNHPLGDTLSVLPIITGDLHIHNTSDTAIKEIDLYNKYGASGRFDDLKITAEYIDPCYRAKFIEYGVEGETVIHGWQRSANQASIAYPSDMDKPERLYYDFLGWAYDSEELKANHSIGTAEDVVLSADGTTWVPGAANTTLTTKGETVTLVAVFQLTKWKISFIDGDGKPLVHPETNNPYWEFSTQQQIVPPMAIPAKDESGLPFTQCYNFLGYTTTAEDTTNFVNFAKAIYPTRDVSYYAQFEEKNIYNNPIPAEQLYTSIIKDNETGAILGVGVALNPDYQRKGKVCVPKAYGSYNVIAILGKSLVDTSEKVLYSAFNASSLLTHIFFEGGDDNTCTVTTFYKEAFANSSSIQYIEIPNSLTTINEEAFKAMPKLKLSNLKNITYFGKDCLRGSSKEAGLTADDTLYISGNVQYFGQYALSNIRYHRINIGTASKPITDFPVIQNGADHIFGFDILNAGLGEKVLTIFADPSMDANDVEGFYSGLVNLKHPYEVVVQ